MSAFQGLLIKLSGKKTWHLEWISTGIWWLLKLLKMWQRPLGYWSCQVPHCFGKWLTRELVRRYSLKHTVFLCEFSSSRTTLFQSLRREGSDVWPTVGGSTHWRRSEIAGASLLAQWLRILLAMQETWVQSLVWEDPWCSGATNPVCRNYWRLRAPEPELLNRSGHGSEKPEHCNEEEPPPSATRENPGQQGRPGTAINK